MEKLLNFFIKEEEGDLTERQEQLFKMFQQPVFKPQQIKETFSMIELNEMYHAGSFWELLIQDFFIVNSDELYEDSKACFLLDTYVLEDESHLDPDHPKHPLRRRLQDESVGPGVAWTILDYFFQEIRPNRKVPYAEMRKALEVLVKRFGLIPFLVVVGRERDGTYYLSARDSLKLVYGNVAQHLLWPDVCMLYNVLFTYAMQTAHYELKPCAVWQTLTHEFSDKMKEAYRKRMIAYPETMSALRAWDRKTQLWPWMLVRLSIRNQGHADKGLVAVFGDDALCAVIASYLCVDFTSTMLKASFL